MSNHDLDHYTPWRKSRIAKLEQIFTRKYFEGRRILECGAGNGLIGKYLREELGAEVAFTEGRWELMDTITTNNPRARVYLVDHDKPWDLGRKFDLVIHWGLLYHLDNWRQDLGCVAKHLDLGASLCLETEIIDYPYVTESYRKEPTDQDDQALNGRSTIPTAKAVEDRLRELNLDFKRYDDADLNAAFHHYDWVEKGLGAGGKGQRRFWVSW